MQSPEAELRSDWTDIFLDAERGKIHVALTKKASNDTTIVFIHGAFVNCETMRPLAQFFSETQCLLLDLPAHGKSSGTPYTTVENYMAIVQDVLQKLAEKQEIHRHLIMVGWSMGGSITMELALSGSLPIQKIVLLSSSPMWKFPAFTKETFHFAQIFSASISQNVSIAVKNHLIEELPIFEAPVDSSLTDISALNAFDIRAEIGRITFPTLVISGTADTIAPLEMEHFMAENVPHSKLKLFADKGHVLLLEEPQSVADEIKTFLAVV